MNHVFQVTDLFVPPSLLATKIFNLGQASVIKLFLSRIILPKNDLLSGIILEMPHFFLLCCLDLNIELILALLDQAIVIFEHHV